MALQHNPKIVTNGLVLCLDAGNPLSYSGSGTVWNDLSGNGYNGTLTNGPTFSSDNKGSIVFDGTNDHIVCTTNTTLDNISSLTNFTVEGFVKWNVVPTAGEGQWIMANVNPSGNVAQLTGGLQFGYNPSVGFVFGTYRAGGFDSALSSTTAIANIWYHLTGLKLSTGYYLYINGNLIASTLTANNGGVAPTVLLLGLRQRDITYPSTTTYLNGNIANVKIYNRGLSESEIQQNYNATKGRFGL